jgi:hypothetical protein
LLPFNLRKSANGELGEVVAEVDGSQRDDLACASMTCATLSERKAPGIVAGPPDSGHLVSHRFERKSFNDLDDDEDMDAQACSGGREVAWPRELAAWIDSEKKTPALALSGTLSRRAFGKRRLLKDFQASRANHGSWFALLGMGLTALMAIGCRVGRLV